MKTQAIVFLALGLVVMGISVFFQVTRNGQPIGAIAGITFFLGLALALFGVVLWRRGRVG